MSCCFHCLPRRLSTVRWSLRDRRAALIAVLYFVALLGAAAASTPRRVGDGGEYVVMAMQLASGRGPSVSAGQLAAFKDELLAVGGGFESSLLDYPDLVAADGGQDFLHFFLYPLVVAPVMSIARTVDVHPNWAFTVVNALLLAGALFLIARHVPLIAVIAGFVSPIIWWVDKAHTEAFWFALVSVMGGAWRRRADRVLTIPLHVDAVRTLVSDGGIRAADRALARGQPRVCARA
jgi:hypothetical protein